MNKCRDCGQKTEGVLIHEPDGGDEEYIPDMCENCLATLIKEVEGELTITQDLRCPKCQDPTTFLRNGECIGCYYTRVDVVVNLPMEAGDGVPPLGWNYPAEQTKIEYGYSRLNCRNFIGRDI